MTAPADTVLAAVVLRALGEAGATVATAESLTGGRLAAALVDVPGSSAVFRGGVVAYATDLKVALLGVDEALLRERGPVDADVAEQMATGVRARLGATYGVSTTGVAGPGPQDGVQPGTVHLAVAGPAGVRRQQLRVPGDRAAVRTAVVDAALALLDRCAKESGSPDAALGRTGDGRRRGVHPAGP